MFTVSEEKEARMFTISQEQFAEMARSPDMIGILLLMMAVPYAVGDQAIEFEAYNGWTPSKAGPGAISLHEGKDMQGYVSPCGGVTLTAVAGKDETAFVAEGEGWVIHTNGRYSGWIDL